MDHKKSNIILEEYENKFSYKKSKTNLNIEFNRIAFIFFVFLVISIIFSIQLLHLGSLKQVKKVTPVSNIKNYRADIMDRNGNYLAKTVSSIDIGINPVEIIDKQKLLINLKLLFPKKNYLEIEKKIDQNKFFYFEKKISLENYEENSIFNNFNIGFSHFNCEKFSILIKLSNFSKISVSKS